MTFLAGLVTGFVAAFVLSGIVGGLLIWLGEDTETPICDCDECLEKRRESRRTSPSTTESNIAFFDARSGGLQRWH